MSALPTSLPVWLRSGRVLVGLVIVCLIALIALFAPLLAPHDPNEQNLISTFLPPAWAKGGEAAFPFGTDSLGRCTLSRLIYGARIAMTVAIVASLGAMTSARSSPMWRAISAAGSTG